MKVYTKRGDLGQTDLYDGTRINKQSLRVESYGTLDELSSFIGLAKCAAGEDKIKEVLNIVQLKLFDISAELATIKKEKQKNRINEEEIAQMEDWIDMFLENIPPAKSFIVPGSNQCESYMNVCRTVCRRAERNILRLAETEEVSPFILKYMNRLSDLFYALGRKTETDTQKVIF
ncbi:MAG: ATP:cob(I)alamin adenosyltransferase [Candidatus Cloacimonadota bacterium]|nr:MAG: ATP:cob(I)alamin adenosyltransferase [Candidatus Cloacimonadota bacterium]